MGSLQEWRSAAQRLGIIVNNSTNKPTSAASSSSCPVPALWATADPLSGISRCVWAGCDGRDRTLIILQV